MNVSLFNDASPTNLHVVTSPVSTYSCPWIQTSLTCAPAQVVVFHLLHTDRMPCTPCPKKYTPWLLTVSCCDLFATLLMHPLIQLDYPYAVINDHPHCRHCHTQPPNQNPGCFCQLSSPQQNSLKVRLVPPPCPFPYSSRFLIHVCSCMYSCQLK